MADAPCMTNSVAATAALWTAVGAAVGVMVASIGAAIALVISAWHRKPMAAPRSKPRTRLP